MIIREHYININDICEILKYSNEYNAKQLRNYYEQLIKANKELIKMQLLELCKNVTNYEEILKMTQKSKILDSLLSYD